MTTRSSLTRRSLSKRAPAARGARAAALLLGALFLATACGASASPTIPPGATGSLGPAETATPPASASPSPSPTPAASFPLTITDDEGTVVTIPSQPQRIVSLTPATTETLFALGAGDRTVARVQDVADYPPAAHDLPEVAKFGSVDVEKIVSLKADLVIAGGNGFNPPEAIAQLRSLKIPVVVVYAQTVDGVLRDLQLTGLAIGLPGPAGDLVAAMRAGFGQVSAATASLDHPRTFYEIDASNGIYGPARDSFVQSMVTLAGGDAITTGSTTSYQIQLEALVAADPQLILLGDAAYGATASQVAARPGWSGMTAVRTNAIRPVDDLLITRPGPRLVDGLRALALAIHPDLVLPSLSPLPVASPGGGPSTAPSAVAPSTSP